MTDSKDMILPQAHVCSHATNRHTLQSLMAFFIWRTRQWAFL